MLILVGVKTTPLVLFLIDSLYGVDMIGFCIGLAIHPIFCSMK